MVDGRVGVLALMFAISSACGGAEVVVRTAPVGEPIRYEGIVSVSRGAPVDVGDSCEVIVQRTNDASYNCRIRVRCGDELVYGLPDAGYNQCRPRGEASRFVRARDQYGTRADGDPRMSFDRRRGRVIVVDVNPDLEVVVGIPPAP